MEAKPGLEPISGGVEGAEASSRLRVLQLRVAGQEADSACPENSPAPRPQSATLGQLVESMTHELRNPLNVIKTSAYYLLHAHQPSAEKTSEHLRRIDRQVRVANRVLVALADSVQRPATRDTDHPPGQP